MIDVKHIATKPEDVGIDSEKLEAVFARAKRDVDDGTLPSAQVAVARPRNRTHFRSRPSPSRGSLIVSRHATRYLRQRGCRGCVCPPKPRARHAAIGQESEGIHGQPQNIHRSTQDRGDAHD
jgi:hypothetical protein